MSEPKPLSEKQELIAEAWIESGGHITKTDALAAGYSGVTAAKKALESPNVKAHLAGYLDEAGATLQKSAKRISEAMDAEEVKFFSFEGEVTDERTVVDHKTRLSATKLNLEARGELNAGVNITFNRFGDLTDEQLAKMALGEAPVDSFLPGGLAE